MILEGGDTRTKKVKEVMLEKFSSKKTEAEIMREAVTLSYDGSDIKSFIAKADKLYTKAKFDEESKLGLIREALKTDPVMLQFVLFQGVKDYQATKDACHMIQKLRRSSIGRINQTQYATMNTCVHEPPSSIEVLLN